MILLKRDRSLRVTPMTKVFIIAEAGVNHNGSLELAKKLIDVAVEAGADAVKFQTFKADKLVSKHAQKADYQKQTTSTDESQYDMIKKLELDDNAHRVLIRYCKDKKIMFLSTPFDHESIDLLNSFQMSIFKIPSGEITNLPYLRHIGGLSKEVILSTGMANLGEIEDALDILIQSGTSKEKITVLHATTEYPCPIDEVNLRAMQTIKAAFGVKVGYSDHTQGIEVPIAAIAMGACVIEKHFTLDRTMDGPDHKASLEPDELKAMVRAIRHIEQALGDGIKKPSKSEAKNIPISRKSIVAATAIKLGEVFSVDNLAVKRPGAGINPMRWDEVIGKVANREYLPDDVL
jgi:N,N'-diacetyllegionaminate synthase